MINSNYSIRLSPEQKATLEEKAARQGRTLPKMMKDDKLRLADILPVLSGPIVVYFSDGEYNDLFPSPSAIPFPMIRFSVEKIAKNKEDAISIYLGTDWRS